MGKDDDMSDDSTGELVAGDPIRYAFDVSHGWEHEGIKVRWGGREVLWHEVPIDTPAYPYALLKFCTEGAGVLTAGGQRWEITPGTVFWSTIRYPVTLTAAQGLSMVNLAIALSGKGVDDDFERYLHAPVGAEQIAEPHPIRSIFDAIMEEGRGTKEHREEVCALLVSVLLRRIDGAVASTAQSNSLARQTFKRCREHIERNFSALTTLGEVAQACSVTVPYLCRLFDQFFGRSPYDYLTRLKMSRAEYLLFRSSKSIGAVAAEVGYKDARLFARNFKAAFGKNPVAYRKAHEIWAKTGKAEAPVGPQPPRPVRSAANQNGQV
jgi:AraC-like DNA-binding protein